MVKPVKYIAADVKAILDNRLLELTTTQKRISWEEIKRSARTNRIKVKKY